MSEKRKDRKGRILRNGETQRSDGMYMYRFKDAGGVRRTIYSWRLVETDKLPPKKKPCEPLRTLEKQLERDTDDGIKSLIAAKKSVNDFYEKYMSLKIELKPSTRSSYSRMYDQYVREGFGERSIGSIKYSDIKKFYSSLYYDKGLKPNTIHSINTILHPLFTLAVRDGYIRSNPAYQVYTELKKQNAWTQEKRHALTIQQQTAFINFLKNSSVYNKWYNLFVVFLGTGCRVGEIIGLRWDDCDFNENIISINHNMTFCGTKESSKRQFFISTPKTKAGERTIPMLSAVRQALLDEYNVQSETGFNKTVIDGYSGFVFKNKNGGVLNPLGLNKVINRIIAAYNDEENINANNEMREAVLLPHFSVHNLRHTFCTRFCENETNLKIIQEIMGHSSITVTMDIYNEVTQEQKKISFANLEDKIRIE